MRQVLTWHLKHMPTSFRRPLSAGQLTSPTSPLISGGRGFFRLCWERDRMRFSNALIRESGCERVPPRLCWLWRPPIRAELHRNACSRSCMTATALSGFLQSEGASLGDSCLQNSTSVRTTLLECALRRSGNRPGNRDRPSDCSDGEEGAIVSALACTSRAHFAGSPLVHLPTASGTGSRRSPETPAPVATTTPDLGSFAPRQLADVQCSTFRSVASRVDC